MTNPCRLEDVLFTQELDLRPVRVVPADTEIGVLRHLGSRFVNESSDLLNETLAAVCELCQADSAGITLREIQPDGRETLRWVATTGPISKLGLQALPRDYSPCGVVLDRQAAQLFSRPRRFFKYIEEAWDVGEVLLVPWQIGETISGTLWAIMADDSTRFDREDLRRLQTLVAFASAAVCRNEIETSKRAQEGITSAARVANELAHAMNNPLQALTNSLYLIDSDSEGHLGDARQELLRLSELVRINLALHAGPWINSTERKASDSCATRSGSKESQR